MAVFVLEQTIQMGEFWQAVQTVFTNVYPATHVVHAPLTLVALQRGLGVPQLHMVLPAVGT